jgi:heme O synthase-like polyprenyltransferase
MMKRCFKGPRVGLISFYHFWEHTDFCLFCTLYAVYFIINAILLITYFRHLKEVNTVKKKEKNTTFNFSCVIIHLLTCMYVIARKKKHKEKIIYRIIFFLKKHKCTGQ